MKMKKEAKDAIADIKTVIKSCKEGKSGKWDCSTDEGKEGFDAMVWLLQSVIEKIKKL
jgi:hypothetical protein